jgi:hypothetical protein
VRYLVSLLILLFLLAACGSNGEATSDENIAEPVSEQDMTVSALTTAIAASAEPPYDPAALMTELETAVALWQSQGVARYEITARHSQPTWNTQVIAITVEDGVVIDSDHTCFPQQDCILKEVDPETVTIEAMFETAESVIGFNDPETQITFSSSYGYPSTVIYEDASWVLDGFKRLDDE